MYEYSTKIDDFRPECNSLPPERVSHWGLGFACPRARLFFASARRFRSGDARLVEAMPDSASPFHLLLTGDPALLAIVRLSLVVSLSAVAFGALIGVPCGAAVALTRFAGREVVIIILNALMGLPPVVVGLAIYLLLSRSGPLGAWGLLFTPQAMIVAQTMLIAPIIAALARQTVEDLWSEY